MTEYSQIKLIDLLEKKGEPFVKEMLSSFSCPLNQDIEDYLHKKAVIMAQKNISPTYLVFTTQLGKPVLIGYYTIALKTLTIRCGKITRRQRDKIKRFGSYDENQNAYQIPAYLIAQLGKNFSNGYDKLITGDELLKMACDRVKESQNLVGGKVVYLECEDKPRLITFYENNGFTEFDKREIEEKEKRLFKSDYLIQMLKLL